MFLGIPHDISMYSLWHPKMWSLIFSDMDYIYSEMACAIGDVRKFVVVAKK